MRQSTQIPKIFAVAGGVAVIVALISFFALGSGQPPQPKEVRLVLPDTFER